jgi:hypothetical protein
MNANAPVGVRHAETLRAWQLAILRYAMTLDHADRATVLAIASEIDGLGPGHESQPDFRFFRKTSVELCGAILRPNENNDVVLRQFLARMDDSRLRRVFAEAIEARQPKPRSTGKPVKRDGDLWRGLSSRNSHHLP